LSGRVSPVRMSQAYSIHIFAGFAGTAAAPATLLILAGSLGWRGAFLVAAALGVVVAAAMLLFGEAMAGRDPAQIREKENGEKGVDSRILFSAPILLSLCFYMLLAMAGGLQIYGIVALEALWGTPLSLATTAITACLAMSAFAVLVGGFVAARTERHDLVAVTGLALNALALVPIAFFDLGAAALIGLMGLSGFFNGVLQPSRDMIVRAVTPPGAFGRVFGFVTTGFNIGGVIAPPIFGYLMDNGEPRLVILGVALCALISVPTVMITVAQRAQRG
ncbi:MAG: MFS transporter, partial [Pseudorhodoplanes sp.]|nr:MFS transporter [Pseudorhodoplanes sp.]